MAKKAEGLNWFGADTEHRNDGRKTEAVIDGFNGVDSDVPKTRAGPDGTLTRVLVRKPAPRQIRVVTSAKDADIGKLTARYKMARSAFQFAPVSDKDMWEKRMQLAYHEMQIARFRQVLAREEAGEARPEQIIHLKDRIAKHRGYWSELAGVEV